MDTTQALKDLLFANANSEEKIIQSARKNAQKALSQADKVTLDAERLPTISEFLESLDGYGLTITDDDLIMEALSERGQAPFDLVQTFKPSELANVEALKNSLRFFISASKAEPEMQIYKAHIEQAENLLKDN